MNIAVIFGGKSDEHEVSRMSAANVLGNLYALDKYDVYKIGITKGGTWYLTEASRAEIENGTWEHHENRRVCPACDPESQGILVFEEDHSVMRIRIDCAVLVLHGDYGEDGTIQGALEMSGIPYTGPGVKSSANCMDKAATKIMAATTGVRQAEYAVITAREYYGGAAGLCGDPGAGAAVVAGASGARSAAAEGAAGSREAALARADQVDGGRYPKFVKPAAAGSSVGATKVADRKDLDAAIELALRYDDKVLVEEMIVGRELEVAVLGNDEPAASAVGEILTAGEFYDYDSKYNNPDSKTWIPDDLPGGVSDEIRAYAIQIYKALDCRGLSRVDFFYSGEKGVVFNEINTLPGFTNISMYPQLWKAAGVDGPELIDRLIGLALERK